MGSTETGENDAPRKPRLTKSQYIKRMLDDPTIGEATKAQIRADDPLFDVMMSGIEDFKHKGNTRIGAKIK